MRRGLSHESCMRPPTRLRFLGGVGRDRTTVRIGVFAHCAVVFLNAFVLGLLSHRGAKTPTCAKTPIPVRKVN